MLTHSHQGRLKFNLFALARCQYSTNPKTSTGIPRLEDKHQFLQKSTVPTNKFQASLPRLGIPKLELTCERYLKSQRPLLTDDEYEQHSKLVEHFRNGQGKSLDEQLRAHDKAHKETSYISDPWFDMYLADRSPLVFTHNPGIAWDDDPRPEYMDVSVRAANILISSLRFHKSFMTGTLYPDVYHLIPAKTDNANYWNKVKWMPNMLATPLSYLFKAFPLCMNQWPNLLQSTRVPKPGKDVLKRNPDAKHMLFLKNGHFYVFDLYDENGDIYDASYYLSNVRAIVQSDDKPDHDIGALTTENRDVWANARAHLEALGNTEALDKIDTALFAICLDDWTHDPEAVHVSSKNMVCGPNPANRWFDKSFSLIFSNNGVVGINFEHAWGDGVAVMRYVNEVMADSRRPDAFVTPQTAVNKNYVRVERLKFKVDEKIRTYVREAKEKYHKKLDSVVFKGFYYHGLGRTSCKKGKISPDCLMQSAFQIAYHRLYGKFVPVYESCSTAIFRHGRTETMRPLTNDSKALALAFNSSNPNEKEILELFRKSSATHGELTRMAAQGKGWDRHLFSLKYLAMKTNQEIPDFFNDPAYLNINKNILSTSTLSSENMVFGGFCPVVPNGFGLGYQIRKDMLGLYCSSYAEHTNVDEMNDALYATFDDMARVINAK